MARTTKAETLRVAITSTPYFGPGAKFASDHEYVKLWPQFFADDDSEEALTRASLAFEADIAAAKANRDAMYAKWEARDAAKAAAAAPPPRASGFYIDADQNVVYYQD